MPSKRAGFASGVACAAWVGLTGLAQAESVTLAQDPGAKVKLVGDYFDDPGDAPTVPDLWDTTQPWWSDTNGDGVGDTLDYEVYQTTAYADYLSAYQLWQQAHTTTYNLTLFDLTLQAELTFGTDYSGTSLATLAITGGSARVDEAQSSWTGDSRPPDLPLFRDETVFAPDAVSDL